MNNLPSPKVSVCTPVYNGGEFISESIQSVLAQTYEDFELVICDNCSTDNTEEIVRGFRDKRIKYVRNSQNLGIVRNANRCLELAEGEYVNILHHDDLMMPDNLARKVHILDENKKVGLVHSDVLLIDQVGKPLDLIKFRDAKSDYITDGIKAFQKYIRNMAVGASFFIGAVLARRECYLKVGGFNTELPNTHDSEMWMRMSLYYDVACIGEPLVKYRYHDMMTSTSISDDNGLNLRGLKEHYLAADIVLKDNKNRIAEFKMLKKQISIAFAMRALNRALRQNTKDKIYSAISYFRTAFVFYPPIFSKAVFWKFIIGLMKNRFRKFFTVA